MTNFVEVFNKATGRNEIIPEDWLDSPVLNHDVNGDPLERVVPTPLEEIDERPTEKSTHDEIDAFAKRRSVTFPEGAKTKKQKMEVLDELAPAAPTPEEASTVPGLPESEPGVELVAGTVSTESTIPAFQNQEASAEDQDKEN